MRVKETAPSRPTIPPASVPKFGLFRNKRNANLMFKSSENCSLYDHVSTSKKRHAGSVHEDGDKNIKPICNKNQNLKNAANQGAAEQDGDIEPQSYTTESVESVDSDDEVGLDEPPQTDQTPVSESVESVDSDDEVDLDEPLQTEQPPVSESLRVLLGDCLMKIDQMSHALEDGIGSLTSGVKSLKDEQKANASLRKELKILRRDNRHLRRKVDDAETQISALKIVADRYYVMKETCSELKTEWEDFKISTLTGHKQMHKDLQIRAAQISSLEQELDSLRKILRMEKEKASNELKLAELCEKQDQDFQQKLKNATEDLKACRENIKETSSRFRLELESRMV